MKIFHAIARIGLAASIELAGCVPPDDDIADVSLASRPIRDQFIVTLRDRGSPDEVAAAARRGGARIRHTYQHALRGFSFEGPPALAEALARRPDVASVMANRAVETAALTSPQILRTGTNRVDAELNPFAHIDNVDTVIDVNVAVVDRGIDATNDDLRVVGGVDCVAGGDYDPLTEQFVQGQVRGHGTPIAGLIAARDNNVGVVGVAPGARLWSVRVFGPPGEDGTIDDLICGLNWIAATRTDADPTNDIAVANLSLGVENMGDTMPCGPSSQPLHQAVCGMVEVGVVPVVAAGNVAVNADTQAPASYPEVITVGAINDFDGIPGGLSPVNTGGTNPTCRIGVGSASVSTGLDDELAAYSNWGPSVDVVAPGSCINSTVVGNITSNGGSGTSLSAGLVSGAVVLRILAQGGAIPASRADVAAIRAAISRPAGGYAVRYRDAKGYRGGNPSDTCHEPLLNVGPAPAPVREPTLTLAFDEAPGLERTALAVTLRNEGDLPEELTVVARDTRDGAALPSVDLAVEPATCASYTLTLDESAAPVAWRNIEAAAVSRNGDVYPATSRTSAAYARSAKLSAGGAHTCWLDGERQLWCWGNNDRGQLARDPSEGAVALTPILIEGPLAMSPFEDARELAAGEAHTCLRTSLGRVACWGNNDHGQLGDGTALGRFVPAPIAGLVGVAQIVAGSAHTCALLADRTARCWGKNDRGQLGTGDTAGRSSPAAVAGLGEIQWLAAGDAQTCAVVHDGTVRCWGTAGPLSSLTPAPVAGLGSVTEVALGARHGCARTAAGKVRCWGGNDHGQLGNNSWRDSVVPVAVDELANLVVSQLAVGWQHSCAREPGGIRCWGDNAWGQIGDDSTMTTKVPEKVKMPAGFDGADVRQGAAGAFHGCLRELGGRVACWGNNGQGQLGDGTVTQRSRPVWVGFGGEPTAPTAVCHAGEARCKPRRDK